MQIPLGGSRDLPIFLSGQQPDPILAQLLLILDWVLNITVRDLIEIALKMYFLRDTQSSKNQIILYDICVFS